MRDSFWLLFIGFLLCLNARAAADPITGAEQLFEHLEELRHKKIALVINHTSSVSDTLLPLYLKSRGIKVELIFSPEHGLYGQAAAGEKVKNGVDSATGIAVISLYGQNKSLDTALLTGIDLIIFDMQDVGARFYTYLSTLHYTLKAAGLKKTPIWVLDRPNPMLGKIDGPLLEPAYTSFVGMHPIPILHGLTFGEMAQMIVDEGWLGITSKPELRIIKVKNYDTKRPYELPIPPSPNLPGPRSVEWYASLCLFEGTPVSMGRGTPYPFEVLLLPDSARYEAVFKAWESLEGSEPILLVPKSIPSAPKPPYLGQKCRGIRVVHSPQQPIDLRFLLAAYANFPDQKRFFNSFFDKLAGTNRLAESIRKGATESEIRSQWSSGLNSFIEKQTKYQLYPR